MIAAPHSSLVERVAFALWRDDSIRAAVRQRTLEQWLDESEDTRNRWRRSAQAALAACHAEEMRAFIREIANDDLDRVSPGLISRAATLLTKLDAAS